MSPKSLKLSTTWLLSEKKTSESKVLYTLFRLEEEFESFVQSVIAREGDISVHLQTMLGDMEIRQQRVVAHSLLNINVVLEEEKKLG